MESQSTNKRKRPSYDELPDWSLIGVNDVVALTGMSHATLERRIRSGEIDAPGRQGQNRVWRLGDIRAWCSKTAEAVDPACF